MSHPTLAGRLIAVAASAAALAGCAVSKDADSFIVLTRIIVPTCSENAFDPGTAELSFGTFSPAGRSGAVGVRMGVVVANRLAPNDNTEAFRSNTNDVVLERAVITYEAVEGGGPVPGETITPLHGFVPANTELATGVLLMPAAAAAAVADGTTVRFFIRVEGHTLDGAGVSTEAYEYVLTACNSTTSCVDVNSVCAK